MKKILAALVALAALTAAAPALGADLGARSYYNKAPVYAAPLYNWTGFYIGGHLGGAFSGSNNFNGARAERFQRPPARRRSGRPRLAIRAELGARHRGPVFLARQEQPHRHLPRRLRLHQRSARPRLDHGPHRLHLGSGPGLCQRRLRLFRQQREGDPRPAFRSPSCSMATTATARPSAPASNTCVAPNWSVKGEYMYYDFGSTRFVTPAALAPFGKLPHRRPHAEARRQLSLQLRKPGGCTLLIAFNCELQKAGFHAGLFVFGRVFRFTEKSVEGKQSAAKNAAKSLPISKLVNRVPGYCRARKHLKVAWTGQRANGGIRSQIRLKGFQLRRQGQSVCRLRRHRRHGDRHLRRRRPDARAARRDHGRSERAGYPPSRRQPAAIGAEREPRQPGAGAAGRAQRRGAERSNQER